MNSRIALALAELESHKIMRGNLYQEACAAFSAVVDDVAARPATTGAMMRDLALTPAIGPFAQPNLSVVVVAGIAARSRPHERFGNDFGCGADAVMASLTLLARHQAGVVMAPAYARDTAYSAILWTLTLEPRAESAAQLQR